MEGRSELQKETTTVGPDLRTSPVTTQQVRAWVDENPSLRSTPGLFLSFHLLWIVLVKTQYAKQEMTPRSWGSETGSAEAGGLEEPKIRGTGGRTNLRKAI